MNGTNKAVAAAVLFFAAASSGCAARLHSGSRLNGPEGRATFRRLPDASVAIDLSVKHLRDPNRLDPPAWAYVAWVRAGALEPAQNLGPLRVNKELNGELQAVTPLQRFELFVTAEPDGTVESPTSEPLLWTAL